MHRVVSLDVAAQPETLYMLVSDLERMGEWSPENAGGEWQSDSQGGVGDQFVGLNRAGEYEWSVLCEVTVAEPGKMFEWVTRPDIGPCVRWTYGFTPNSSGTTVTETWDVEQLPPSLESRTPEQLAKRAETVHKGMRTTLENLKAFAEG